MAAGTCSCQQQRQSHQRALPPGQLPQGVAPLPPASSAVAEDDTSGGVAAGCVQLQLLKQRQGGGSR